ncbi:36.4 kDa proline-rich protein-like [Ananas comosus]|uniref:36.4 kDa proline-rich protein-like n=1 Tax=Ananas comosus TaxID=4615 RepID=A0A199V3W5_ANACO|nr:36.4 kDa proline-rich protein-like [Ananas comosus]XP_020107165.1 36.4 kDa proline-rich protein-like [Ananas comosus]OAY71596.1 pEARLI1-like lipid transfer protein 1 [Ananas comosus]
MMAMDSSKITALLLILILSISSTPLTLACGSCPTPSPETPSGPILPPIIGKPPITLPPIIGKPPITIPPITVPPITIPPIIGGTPPTTVKPGCSPPPQTCPIDALKFGVCIDCLGNEIHLGDPAVQCCPLISGLAGVAAAACLCTAIKAKLLDINIYLPLVFKLLITCGYSIPPGYTCPN